MVGDLIIYKADPQNPSLLFGHVAVVVDVDLEGHSVEVAEQNFLNQPWPAEHARRLVLTSEGKNFRLTDSPNESLRGDIYGWLRIEQ